MGRAKLQILSEFDWFLGKGILPELDLFSRGFGRFLEDLIGFWSGFKGDLTGF